MVECIRATPGYRLPTSLLPFLNAALICTVEFDLFCMKQLYSRGWLPSEKNVTASVDATSDTPFVVILSNNYRQQDRHVTLASRYSNVKRPRYD